MREKSAQFGFAIPPIFLILGFVILIVLAITLSNKQKVDQQSIENLTTSNANITSDSSPSSQPSTSSSAKPSSTKSPSPTPKTSSTPSPSPSSSSTSNPYDLTSPSGAVRVVLKAQNGVINSSPQAQLIANGGFKVLDGKSTDRISQSLSEKGTSGQKETSFSTAPAGPYTVKISLGSWSDSKTINVESTKLSTAEFTFAGETPTPTPQKPVCSVSLTPDVNTGSAPFNTTVCVGNNSNPSQNVTQEFLDYEGDGSWDYQGAQYGCHSYTYSSPGSFTAKAKIIGSSGVESDVCQTSITIN